MREPIRRKLHMALAAALCGAVLLTARAARPETQHGQEKEGGCGSKEPTITETVIDTVDSNLSNDKGITIYRVKDRAVVAEGDPFQPKQPDSVANALEETMGILPLTGGVHFQAYTMGSGNSVSLIFNVDDSVSKESLLLEKAAVVSTVEQIRNIGVITLSIRDKDGETIEEGVYSSKSFYYYDDVVPTGQNTGQIDIFVPDENRKGLTPVSLMVTLQLDSSVEEEVVRQLIDRGALPGKTQLISLSVTQKVAYVDLSREFLEEADAMAVYSLVDSICNLPHVSAVQILIDGEKQDKIGTLDTHVPMTFTRP